MARREAPRGAPVQVGTRPAARIGVLSTSVLVCGPIFRYPGEPAGAPFGGLGRRGLPQGGAASIPMPAALWGAAPPGRPPERPACRAALKPYRKFAQGR